MDGTVIIADDDKNLRAVLTQSLTRAGARVRSTATLSTLWRWLEDGEGDVVLCDVNLADGDALEELPKLRQLRPDLQFVLMSAQNTVITALRAGEAGAFDYLAKPFDLREMIETLLRAQKQVNATPRRETSDHDLDLPLLGRSEVMQEIYRNLSRIIPSDMPVLITGETGTGKSLVAEVLHRFGPRKAMRLVRYDGSNSGGISVRESFETAGEGTLILEKLDDYFPSEQREILQAIESGQYQARIVATATHSIHSSVDDGQFRADLYHQINVLNINMPSLSDHIDDIGELAESFVHEESDGSKYLEDEAVQALMQRSWPGNVKELQSAMKRVVAMSPSDVISASDLSAVLPMDNRDGARSAMGVDQGFSHAVEAHVRRFMKLHGNHLPPNGFYNDLIGEVDKATIEVVLELTGGNQIKTADILGINRNTLRKKIQNLDISVTKGKKLM